LQKKARLNLISRALKLEELIQFQFVELQACGIAYSNRDATDVCIRETGESPMSRIDPSDIAGPSVAGVHRFAATT
jgi:hypothetical protein